MCLHLTQCTAALFSFGQNSRLQRQELECRSREKGRQATSKLCRDHNHIFCFLLPLHPIYVCQGFTTELCQYIAELCFVTFGVFKMLLKVPDE